MTLTTPLKDRHGSRSGHDGVIVVPDRHGVFQLFLFTSRQVVKNTVCSFQNRPVNTTVYNGRVTHGDLCEDVTEV
jgi:hypothetical protein